MNIYELVTVKIAIKMEEDQYLTDESKADYMTDFRNLLCFKESAFWDIDEGLETLLIKINANRNFQTLYSKKFKINPDSFVLDGESYLELAFRNEAYDELLQLLNHVKDATSCKDSQINIVEYEPSENANHNNRSQFQIGCINNPDYFRIKRIKISIESQNIECHDIFWHNMTTAFDGLN